MINHKGQANRTLDVAAIIPFKDNVRMTYQCVDSLVKYGPKIKEIIVISNNSKKTEYAKIKQLFSDRKDTNIHLYKHNTSFNFQKLNNWAVRKSSASSLLFVNNDVKLTVNSKGVIERMYKKSKEPRVGVVGTLLLYEDETTIQHFGVYLEAGGAAKNILSGKKRADFKEQSAKHYLRFIDKDRKLSAVTAAFCLVEKSKFLSVRGFNENFVVGGGDVDLCLRLNAKNFQTWFLSDKDSYVIHKEKVSRRKLPIPYSDYYWSYLSYISAFDLNKGDSFLPKIIKNNLSDKKKDNQTIQKENLENYKPIDLIYPLLPDLKQKPKVNIVMAFSKNQIDEEFHKIIKGVNLAKVKQMDINIISNLNFPTSTIKELIKTNHIDFNLKVTKSMIDKDGPRYIIKLPMHPQDLFYCVKRKDITMIKKLPIHKNMIVKRKQLGSK